MVPIVIVLLCLSLQKFAVCTETEVSAHVGSTVSLPCRVDTEQCGSLHSVKWYRDTSRIYVFSHVGSIARAEGDSTNRMTVEYSKNSVDAKLKISPVHIDDDATYKCEITYLEVRENCDVVQIVKLKTLVRPELVRIMYKHNGTTIQNGTVLPPADEGSKLDLICEARKGKPTPVVRWFNGTKEIVRANYNIIDDDDDGLSTGRSKLEMTLLKGDLLVRFQCSVESAALEVPIISWISPDVHVRPAAMEVYGVKGPVVQGTDIRLSCDVKGARPAASIHWYNGSTPITNETLHQNSPEAHSQLQIYVVPEADGTFTSRSTLSFRVTRWENGKAFHCYSRNEVMKRNNEPYMHSLMVLQVQFPPVIQVAPPQITTNETGNILLLCHYFSNPQHLKRVFWIKDGIHLNISQTPHKYEGGTPDNPPLIINNVSRDDMGEYTCGLENEVGSEQSAESILLNVLYSPSVEVVMEPSLPVKAVDKVNVTLMCNVTAGNPATLSKVRWFLGGELIKELPDCNYTSYDENGIGEGNGGPSCEIDPSILSLERVDKNFAGHYACQGKNVAEWGPVSEPTELIVYYSPSPARLRHVPSKVVKRGSVTLMCSVTDPGIPDNVTYIWYRGPHRIGDVNVANYSIKTVTLAHKGSYTCEAENAGGKSQNATVHLNVSAPPAFIQNLPSSYQGVLYSSKNISLTCRIECSPLCSVIWKKDGEILNTSDNPLYYIKEKIYPPDEQKNDFESIESTLVWNMTAWPNQQLSKDDYNSYYTCQSYSNGVGSAVNSTVEIAVDYPPDDVVASPLTVVVLEDQVPQAVRCQGKGRPQLAYTWRRNNLSELISRTQVLQLGRMSRSDAGHYMCEASNRHGIMNAKVYFNVQYAPDCTIAETNRGGSPALVCTAHANPQEVSFIWSLRDSNDTLESAYIVQEGYKSYLILDAGVDTSRIYQCSANNTVGKSLPCELKVAANLPWWKQINAEKLVIIIAASITLIVCVLVICIVIIILCRRKRASTKYSNPLEMEERENPEGQSPESPSQSKWPLKPGVLVHINKMHNLNISQIAPDAPAFRVTSVPKNYSRYKRNKNKVYARLERLRDFIGFRGCDVPSGIREGANGVVTYKKFIPSTPGNAENVTSRKRKKPGLAPNPSCIEDKTRLGSAPLTGGLADPSSDPDKGFYENLPFHRMQNTPNKPISIIAPFTQATAPSYTSSTKSLLPHSIQTTPYTTPFGSCSGKSLKRNQSFHGFQTNQRNIFESQNFFRNLSNPYLSNNSSQQFHYAQNSNVNVGSEYIKAPQYIYQRPFLTSSNRNPFMPLFHYNLPLGLSCNNLPQATFNQNPFSVLPRQPRVLGRRESDVRRTASGISESQASPNKVASSVSSSKPISIIEKRFNSLELRKHRCYSPTFYSMRCKKHAKKRPVVYALPKKVVKVPEKIETTSTPEGQQGTENFEDLTNSIKILEHKTQETECRPKHHPIPAPRCKRHRKVEIIYQNISKTLKSDDKNKNSENVASNSSTDITSSIDHSNISNELQDDSNSSPENATTVISVTEVQIHCTPSNNNNSVNLESSLSSKSPSRNLSFTQKPSKTIRDNAIDTAPKLVSVSPKKTRTSCNRSSSATSKATQTPLPSPSSTKPDTESPKGALSLQIQARRKSSPKLDTKEKSTESDENAKESLPLIPQMPILDTPNKWSLVLSNQNQNAFYTLTTPHYRQITSNMPSHYSSTIPHPKHAKLIPRTLFSDQQASKSKSFSSKQKQKKHFQIPIQKCHSFKFQTAESYFQPIKNIHEEDLMRNGYVSDYPEGDNQVRHHKREKPKTKGPLVLRGSIGYQDNTKSQSNKPNSVQLAYEQQVHSRGSHTSPNKPNGVVYADLDMPKSSSRKNLHNSNSTQNKPHKNKSKTEYATLKFNDVGQEIDV